MGRVYKAYDRQLRRHVAIKRMHTRHGLSGDQEGLVRARFQGEALLPAQIADDNIIEVYELRHIDDELFIVFQLIPGSQTLLERMRQLERAGGQLPIDEATAYLRQALQGLCALHAHQEGLFHRDVKPDNLLIYESAVGEPRLKLIDFGVAHIPDAGLTAAGDSVGTPTYFPPELFPTKRGERVELDHRMDLFALGMTFYYALSLKRPYPSARDLQSTAEAYTTTTPVSLRSHRSDIAAGLEAVVHRLMEKDREAR